jgi:hypothetical protein
MEPNTQIGMSRRRWCCGCAGSLLLSGCGGGEDGTPPAAGARGCLSVSISASQATSTPGCGIPTRTTGNNALDSAFVNEFNAQGNFWGISGVSFAFLNDCNSPNALANPQDRSILFGTTLTRKLLQDFGSTIPLWQVLAHEWGHQIQFALGDTWLTSPTVAPKELEADMFSGFYLLIAKNNSNLSSSISNAFALGDWEFNNPSHHGTPNQRGAAVLAGGRVAQEYVSGSIARTYPTIRQRFYQELAFIL